MVLKILVVAIVIFILLAMYGKYLQNHPDKIRNNPDAIRNSTQNSCDVPHEITNPTIACVPSGWYWCVHYSVTGINPSTGRRKSVSVIESSIASDAQIGQRSGLNPPYNIENVDRKPSEAQLHRIQRDNISIPEGVPLSIEDATIFITRSEENKKYAPPADIRYVDYAIEHQVYIPKYASNKEAVQYLKVALPHLKSEINSL